jgi:hypothetical protein
VQRDLEERADELQRASRYKSEFLANMSHELRTPLNSSLILAKLLGDNPQGNLTLEQVKFAESIYSSGNDLLVLINDILDIAKVEAGKLEVVPEDVSLARLARAWSLHLQPLARCRRACSFRLGAARCAASLVHRPPAGRADPEEPAVERAQVHRPRRGGADVSAHGRRRAPSRCPIRASASSRAAGTDLRGLPPGRRHHQPALRRHRPGPVDLARPDAPAGRHAHRAEQPGKGSTFTLHLPALAPQASVAQRGVRGKAPPCRPMCRAAAPRRAARRCRSHRRRKAVVPAPQFADDRAMPRDQARRVLVIEDEPQFAHILYDLAHELGYRCLVAHGAADGLELATQFVPDAILLDMRLPDAPA